MSSLDLGTLMEAVGRPDHPIGQLLGALLARAGRADEPAPVRDPRAHLLESRCRLLATRNRVLAEAFGACRCWGTDARCRRCGGDGVPGWEPPRNDWLVELLWPLLERRPEVVRALLEQLADAPSPIPTEPTHFQGDTP